MPVLPPLSSMVNLTKGFQCQTYELYQGLQDIGVDTKLIVYKGFGHGITKPKERLAAMWHNWQWFGKYVWGEEIDMPELTNER